MAWTRTRSEVTAITGDSSVLLAAPPPDGGWTPQLGRTFKTTVTSTSNCSVKLWARPPAGLSSMPTEQPTKRPPSTSIGLGAESGDETRGVGPIGSVRQPCRGVSWLASTLGWPVLGGQPLRWRLSGDTDAMWLDRCGEDAGPTGLPHLDRTVTSTNVLSSPVDSRSIRGI